MSNETQKENTFSIQEQKKQDEALKLRNEEELKSFTPEKAKDLINKAWELLTIDDAEKKEILKNLWDEAPDFLAEIKKADDEFKQIMKIKNNENQSLTVQEKEERMNLFLEKLFIFKETNYNLLEKIDDNDWNWINSWIEATKFDKNYHWGFWNTPEAIWDWLSNWMLTKLNQYQNIFEGWAEWLKKMLDAILNDPVWLIRSIWDEIKKELSDLLDFDWPTYKIAQTIWKFLVDVIIQLVSWWAWIVWKIATTINKLIPDWIIKKWLNKTVDFSSNVVTSSIWINKNLLSPKWMKELWFKWTAKKIWTEAIYYWWFTPWIIIKEWHKLYKNIKSFNTWAKRVNKQLVKEWYKIPSEAYVNLRKFDWQVIVMLVKIEKKIESNAWKEALKYLNLVDKWIKSLTRKNFSKIAILTWKSLLWEKRIDGYIKKENDPNLEKFWQSNLFREFITQLKEKYRIRKTVQQTV